jgi:aromatic ring hydroxylase
MRTPAEYLESIRDGREVWFRGEKVDDVTAHPELGVGARNVAHTYEIEAQPEWADIFWVEEDGRRISRFYKIPRTPDDLLRRHEAIEHLTREARPTLALISKEIGSDALFALLITSRDVDEKYGTTYSERVRRYYEYARDNELDLAVAQTDVKGDRSLRPADQPNPDAYLHIVERRPDGIVVRGAKVHTTDAVYAHEVVVLPTRAMTERDRDYAVAFAIPVNTPGVRLVAAPGASPARPPSTARSPTASGSWSRSQSSTMYLSLTTGFSWPGSGISPGTSPRPLSSSTDSPPAPTSRPSWRPWPAWGLSWPSTTASSGCPTSGISLPVSSCTWRPSGA